MSLGVVGCGNYSKQKDNSVQNSETSFTPIPTVTMGTFDSVASEHQLLVFWTKYENESDSFAIISKHLSQEYIPSIGIESNGDTAWIGSCPEFSLNIPQKSSIFILCSFHLESDVSKLASKKHPMKYVAKSISTGAITITNPNFRLIPGTNDELNSLLNQLPYMKRITQSDAETELACREYIANFNETHKDSANDQPLLVAFSRILKRNGCSVPKHIGLRNPIYSPNWPWIEIISKCKEDGDISLSVACNRAERNLNLVVQRLAGLTKPLETQKAPYKFLAGKDTVYVAASSWRIGSASNIFK